MRLIGGEIEHKGIKDTLVFTDSGRSSLRLFIRSGNREKKFLIPDFLCETIRDVLRKEKVSYECYNVFEDLSVNIESIKNKEYEVLYLINYFGFSHEKISLDVGNKIIIEDNVFYGDFNNDNNYPRWYGYNSYRKISSLSDGSMVKTNLFVDCSFVRPCDAGFVKMKEKAKDKKYEYVNNRFGLEKDYLEIYKEAEQLLDAQYDIHRMSSNSMHKLLYSDCANDQEVMKKRFDILKDMFMGVVVERRPVFYSYFPMVVNNRNEFRSKMAEQGVFLPVHWPGSKEDNCLYEGIVSIPMFSIYSENEFSCLVDKIKRALI